MASHLNEAQASDGLLLPNYGSMSPEERREWASTWRALLASATDYQGAASSSGASPTAAEQAANGPITADKPANPYQTPQAPPGGLTVEAPVDRLRGVNTKLSAKLKRLDVTMVRDLLYLFPQRHL